MYCIYKTCKTKFGESIINIKYANVNVNHRFFGYWKAVARMLGQRLEVPHSSGVDETHRGNFLKPTRRPFLGTGG